MMRGIGGTAVCLAACAAALGMTAATAAAAEPPEYGRCLAKTGGTYEDAACTKTAAEGKEKYEWYPGFSGEKPLVKKKFTLIQKEKTSGTYETVNGSKMTCSGATGSGEITGAKDTTGSYAFTGCKTSGLPCNSGGAKPEELVGRTLSGLLGIEEEGVEPFKNLTAEDLFPAEPGGLLVEFECSGIGFEVRGSVLNPTTRNKMLDTVTLKWAATKGRQKPEKFVGGEKDVCEVSTSGGPFEQCGGTVTLILHLEEKIEINTVV
jgi:hypothetical protein